MNMSKHKSSIAYLQVMLFLFDCLQLNSFSELAAASMQRISTMSSHSYSLILVFVAGLCLGSFVAWKMSK